MQEMEKIQAFGPGKKKFYSEGDVQQVKNGLERRGGTQLTLSRPSPQEISLTCHNLEKYQCGFKYLFRKSQEDPEKAQYLLHTEFYSHQMECINEAGARKKILPDPLSSPSFKRYRPELEPSPQTLSPKMFNLTSQAQKSEKSQILERSLTEEHLALKARHSSKLYTEEEVGALKKQLQFESKGLISKSTEFHPEYGYISKISFRCKYENSSCPYLATLSYTFDRNAKNQKLYRLQKLNCVHQKSCILDSEEVYYNFVTRRIDENFGVLTRIIQEHNNEIKPKRVLELFAQELSEEPDFIYMGIESKSNRRAAKKYFDNSVAKARNLLK